MKLKQWIIKLIKKLIDFIKWVWKECCNWQTILLFGAVCAVIGAPVWVGGVLWFVFGFKWALAIAIGCLAFWWLPGTPFMVLSLTVTLAIKRWGKRVLKKGKSAVKKHNKYVKQKIRESKKYKHSKKKDNAENASSENSSNQVNE